jgi:hypothetical protein
MPLQSESGHNDELQAVVDTSPLEIGESVVDLDQVAAQVQHCLSKAEALGWPVLPVLVRGWQSVES